MSVRLSRWPAMLDAAVDGLVVAFAGWTLLYEVALAAQRSIRWAAWPWLVLTAVGIALVARRAAGRAPSGGTANDPAPAAPATTVLSGRWTLLLAVALAAAVLARSRLGLVPMALVALVGLGAQLVGHRRAIAADRAPVGDGDAAVAEPSPATPLEHAVAGVGALGLAVIGSLLLKPDADDAYYVNRATWIAHHGVPVLKDTMFGPGRLPQATDGGLPTPSVEALQGSLAYALHLSAATVAYLVWVPVMSAVLGWTLWRLIRAWAPHRRLAAYLVALLFLVASGDTITGNYSVGRIWQGKVVALAVLLPLIWVYLTRLARGDDRRTRLLLGCAGIAFVGLTTTSALLAPMVVGAACVAALVLRSRAVLLGALLLLVAPLVNGVAVKFGPTAINPTGSAAAPADAVFQLAFGAGAMAVLVVLALTLAPRFVPGPPAALVAGIAAVTVAVFLPGVLSLANAATGAGPVIWRLAVTAPMPVLVGLLASADVRPLPAWAGAVAAACLVLVVTVGSGAWLWSGAVGGAMTARPTWKVDQPALTDVRAALRLPGPAAGRWLLPEDQMTILSISTAGPYAVVPRAYYLSFLDMPRRQMRDRLALLRLVRDQPVRSARVAHALQALDVTLACVPGQAREARRVLRTATGQQLRSVGSMRCHVGTIAAQAPST